MLKIVIIGAGSATFARNVIMDVLSYEELRESVFSLVDIDKKKLDLAAQLVNKVIQQENLPAKLEVTTDRKKALRNADFVVITIDTPGYACLKCDNLIPYKYGVKQCVGDTLGPGGVFKGLRLIPVIIDICKDIENICPGALVLNYSNPMAIICWAINAATKVKSIGLCHSVNGTIGYLSATTAIPRDEISFLSAGINHQAWILRFERNGQDAYPSIWARFTNPKLNPKYHKPTGWHDEPGFYDWDRLVADPIKHDKIRIEILKTFGYFTTAFSGHSSEYLPYFRKRSDTLRKFCGKGAPEGETLAYFKHINEFRKYNLKKMREEIKSGEKIPFGQKSADHGSDMAADIIYAACSNKPVKIYGNVKNTNLIANLPYGCCVEVPCLVDKNGVQPVWVGDLPPQCAALNRTNINVQELAVKAALTNDKRNVFHAVALDPLSGAVLSTEEIRSMVADMLKAQSQWLAYLK